jgi:pre-rRNA-processing protein TSR4
LAKEEYPKCRNCQGETEVEFQIMPGLLAQMDSDVGGKEEIDWGVLNVLTCKKSCKTSGYVEEYLWRQEVSQEGLKSEADM